MATPGNKLRLSTVFTYHKIGSHLELGITTVKQSRFAAHMDFLLASAIGFACAGDAVGTGQNPRVAVTFDDGYESLYQQALPVMLERGIPGTVFPVVGSVGGLNTWDVNLARKKVRHLSWSQIRELAESGFEIGSHTVSHKDLTKLDNRALRHELRTSKKMIEDKTGVEVRTIAYPFGRCSGRVIDEAVAAGYNAGFVSFPKSWDNRMAMGRWAVYSIDDTRSLERKLGLRAGHNMERLKNTFIAKLSLGTTLVRR